MKWRMSNIEPKISNFTKTLGIYFGIVLVMTFLSKSIYNYQLPAVTIFSPEQGTISRLYDTLIPKAALRIDTIGYYVFVLKEEDSVLGYGYVAQRVSVDLLDFNEEFCAVRGVTADEHVIVTSTGELTDGSKVYYEGNTAK